MEDGDASMIYYGMDNLLESPKRFSNRAGLYGIWEPLVLRPLVETRRVTIAGVSYCWYAPGRPDPYGNAAGHGIIFVNASIWVMRC